MNIPFENWIKTQKFSDDSHALFEESLKCYRVGAYRGAYMLAYVGFLVVVKERALKSEAPEGVPTHEWENSVLKPLRSDTKWEDSLYNALNKRNKNGGNRSKYFLVSDHLLNDLAYLRRRRNDCAHAKDTMIDHGHVEILWSFLQSHLAKFVVDGGANSIINKIKLHFDSEYTRPNSDPTPIINEIPTAVSEDEIPELFDILYTNHLNLETEPFFLKGQEYYVFWETVIFHESPAISKAFLKFLLASDEQTIIHFTINFPQILQRITDQNLLRRIWKHKSFKTKMHHAARDLELPISYLRNNLIHPDDKGDFHLLICELIEIFPEIPTEHTLILNGSGFFTHYKNFITRRYLQEGKDRYNTLNNNTNTIMYCIENTEPDVEIAEHLNRIFSGLKFGRFKDAFDHHCDENPDYVTSITRLLQDKKIEVTSYFSDRLI